MIVTIHQPHFLPWLGYLHRMAHADLFVVLDHVQFERGNYQNRTRVLVDGEPRWMTVPLVQGSQKDRILDKKIDNARRWGAAYVSTLRHAYRDAPHLEPYVRELRKILEAPWTKLAEIDAATLDFLRDAFGIRTPLLRSSELGVSGAKSDLVLATCKAVGASTFLGGMGGSRNYLDTAAFERAGIRVEWQKFQHPRYAQGCATSFTPGLSSVDLLFNCGSRSRDLLLQAREERLAA